MLERTTSVAEQPISIEIGQTFKPFEGLQELPFPKEHETFVESVDYVASREFEINGVKATIALTIDYEDIYSPDVPRDSETPLGTVVLEHHYYNGQEMTVKTPLQLVIFSRLDAIEQFLALRQLQVEFTIGDKEYILDCMEPLQENEGEDIQEGVEIILDGNQNGYGGGAFASKELKDRQGNGKTVVLPYEPHPLTTIQARLVRKPPPLGGE